MICKKCKKGVSILDVRCPHCGNDRKKIDLEKSMWIFLNPKYT